MTQEDKELLLKDICARLPYGVIVDTPKGKGHVCGINLTIFDTEFGVNINPTDRDTFSINDVKPYLFSLSSMTEEHCYELASIRLGFQDCWKYIKTPIPLSICNFEQIDWFNKNHFDYRGLIEKGLAVDAIGLNIY